MACDMVVWHHPADKQTQCVLLEICPYRCWRVTPGGGGGAVMVTPTAKASSQNSVQRIVTKVRLLAVIRIHQGRGEPGWPIFLLGGVRSAAAQRIQSLRHRGCVYNEGVAQHLVTEDIISGDTAVVIVFPLLDLLQVEAQNRTRGQYAQQHRQQYPLIHFDRHAAVTGHEHKGVGFKGLRGVLEYHLYR